MIRSLTVILVFTCLLFSNNRIVHINSTYYDGTPKEIIIYEYSSLYTNNPLKIIDKLNFDKKGNIIFDFDNYFNSKWKILVNDEYSHTVEIFNDEFRFLKPSENCLDCYLPGAWNVSFDDSKIMVEAQTDLSIYDPFGASMLYRIEIITPNEFKLFGGEVGEALFIKTKN
tara:strand:+ start:3612 stop:4121 length:510 start_codon:yes stop_codon:yes gene_type:complete